MSIFAQSIGVLNEDFHMQSQHIAYRYIFAGKYAHQAWCISNDLALPYVPYFNPICYAQSFVLCQQCPSLNNIFLCMLQQQMQCLENIRKQIASYKVAVVVHCIGYIKNNTEQGHLGKIEIA